MTKFNVQKLWYVRGGFSLYPEAKKFVMSIKGVLDAKIERSSDGTYTATWWRGEYL